METGQQRLETEQQRVETGQQRLETEQQRLETEQQRLDSHSRDVEQRVVRCEGTLTFTNKDTCINENVEALMSYVF